MRLEQRRKYKTGRAFKTKIVNARVSEPLVKAFKNGAGGSFNESDSLGIANMIEKVIFEQIEAGRADWGELDYYVFQQWACSIQISKDEFLKKLSKDGFEVKKFNLEFSEEDYLVEFEQFVEPHLIFEFLNENTKKILDRWNKVIGETGKEFYIADEPTGSLIDADTLIKYIKTIEIPEWMSNPTRKDLMDEYKSRIDLIRKNISKNDASKLDDDFINDHFVSTQICKNYSKEYIGFNGCKYIRLSDDKFGPNNRKILVNWSHCDFEFQENYYRPSYIQTRYIVEMTEPTYSVHHVADLFNLSEQRIIELLQSIEITGKTIDSVITKEERSKLIEYLIEGKGEA